MDRIGRFLLTLALVCLTIAGCLAILEGHAFIAMVSFILVALILVGHLAALIHCAVTNPNKNNA